MAALDTLLQKPAAPTLDLETHLDIILDKQRALRELDRHIQASLTEEDFDGDVLDAIDYDERICALRMRMRSVTSPASSGTRFAALPKLRIPMFSGDRRDWQWFWDQFHSSIHSNTTFPRIEKFKYLLSYLTGPAKDAIDGIRLAGDNYEFAIKIITN
ncbi:uncharacterized protein LOC144153435 [Haemaphysalis longicornis]